MKTTTKIKKLISTLLLLIYILGAAACEKDKNEAPETEKLSGKELFKQIILIDGQDIDKKIPEYAPIIEELNKLTPQQQQARKIFNDYITQEVKKNNPTYFGKLKEAVDSKQLYAIKEAINEGNNVVMDALKNSSEHGKLVQALENFINLNPDKYDLNSEQNKEKLVNDLKEYLSKEGLHTDNTSRGFFIAAVVFIGVALVVTATLNININIWYNPLNRTIFSENKLFSEKIVLSIIDKY